jgi:hypothetical protein
MGLKHRTDLTVASVSSLALGWGSGKVIGTFEGAAGGARPVEVFLVSPGSTLCTEAQLKKTSQVEELPHQTRNENYHLDRIFRNVLTLKNQ